MTDIGSRYKYGPFTYTASGATSFGLHVIDGKGNGIDGWHVDDYWNNVVNRN